jgi:DNA-binding NarL/FixJ family response regulator
MKLKVAFVEDNASLRKRFEEQMALFPELDLVSTYASGETAISALKRLQPSRIPEVILMDIGLKGMSGIDTTIALKELFPEIEIMMYTVFEDEPKIFQSIQAGASGYLLKDDPIERVVEAIHELKAGGAPISQSIARTMLSFIRSKPKNELQPGHSVSTPIIPVELSLSERELELLEGLVRGETYATLAEKHHISPHTVKTHIKNIYKKLHVHSRALAVRVAIERKLV